MAAFSVTTAEMTKKISDLRAKNQSLKQQVSKMKESKDELNTTWDGNAKKNFSSAVESNNKSKIAIHKHNRKKKEENKNESTGVISNRKCSQIEKWYQTTYDFRYQTDEFRDQRGI